MFTVFAQPKFAIGKLAEVPVGYELFIREWRDGRWQLPTPFGGIGLLVLNNLLRQTIAQMPANIESLSFNLEQGQFIDPAFTAMIASVQQQTTIRLYTELTERVDKTVTTSQLLAAAKRFKACGLAVCVDDVGTGENSPALVLMLDDYIAEYKFAFQNFQPLASVTEMLPKFEYWTKLAQKQHKRLVWEGIESGVELSLLLDRYPASVLQGYLFGRPQQLENVLVDHHAVSGD